MRLEFNRHRDLEGRHAFLSASKSHWVNYDDEKFISTYATALAALKGAQHHEFAAMAIKLGHKMPRSNKTLNAYVNDAIGFRMTPEQVLRYSDNSFGTADAICFRDKFLRIHDLKTGVTRTTFRQLEVYAALFCLEYEIKPGEIGMEFRIYQNDAMKMQVGDPSVIIQIMAKIVRFDKMIEQMKEEAFG